MSGVHAINSEAETATQKELNMLREEVTRVEQEKQESTKLREEITRMEKEKQELTKLREEVTRIEQEKQELRARMDKTETDNAGYIKRIEALR